MNWRHGICPLILLVCSAPALALRDPTCPPWLAGPSVVRRTPVVEAIWARGGQRLALINGELVSRGSAYGRGRVIAIRQNSVVLRFPSGIRVWPLLRLQGVRKSWIFSKERP